MTNKINASSTSGLSQTGANSAELEIQADGITGIKINQDGTVDVPEGLTVNGIPINVEAADTATVANLSGLKALVTRPSTVIMQSRSINGDSGGGTFIWVSGSSTTPDDALVVQCTSGPSGRYKRIFTKGQYEAAWFGVISDGVTPCDTALKLAAVTAKGGQLKLPSGPILLNGSDTIHLVNIQLTGRGAMNWSNADTPDYPQYQQLGSFGTTFLLTSTSVQPFTVDNSVTIEHCNFYWPNQDGKAQNPIVYPPLLTDRGINYDNSGGVSNNVMINCSVINAYDFLKQSTQALTWGSWKIIACDIYAIRRVFSLTSVAEQFIVMGCVFNASLYFEGAVSSVFTAGISNGSGGAGTIMDVTHVNSGHLGIGYKRAHSSGTAGTEITALISGSGLTGTYTVTPSQFVAPGSLFFFRANLVRYTSQNGSWLHVWGDGEHADASNTLVNMAASNNIVYGYRRAIHVDDGSLDFCTFDPSHHFDGCPQVLYVSPKGSYTHVRLLGTYYSFEVAGDENAYPCIQLDDPAAGGPTGKNHLEISGDGRGINGSFIQAIGDNVGRIEVTGTSVGNWGGTSTSGSYYAIYMSGANIEANIVGNNFYTGASGTKGNGIYVPVSKSLLLSSNRIKGANRAIDHTGNTGAVLILGNQTVDSQGTYSTYGTPENNIRYGTNSFDKGDPKVAGIFRVGDNGLSIYIGGMSPSFGAAPWIGYNLWRDEAGNWTRGIGSSTGYGAATYFDTIGGSFGFLLTTSGGASGATVVPAQPFYLDAATTSVICAGATVMQSSVRPSGVGTTASAANAYLDPADSNNLLRSTSSLRYKVDVEPLLSEIADKVVNESQPIWYRSLAVSDRSEWSFYGLGAEQIAEIEPRLVHWGYREEDYETVEISPEQTQRIELDDGSERWIVYPAKTERRLKPDAKLVPESVMYDRFVVMLLDVVRRQGIRLTKLEEEVSSIKTILENNNENK